MSINEFITDDLTRRQMQIQRFINREIKEILPFLNKIAKDIRVRLSNKDITDFNKTRLLALQKDINRIVASNVGSAGTQLALDLSTFGVAEAAYVERLISGVVTVGLKGVSEAQIRASLNKVQMSLITGKKIQKLTIKQAINQYAKSVSSSINHSIQAGIAEGLTTNQISREVTRVVSTRSRAQAEALIRTSANHTSSVSRSALYDANSDIIDNETFIATLDGHTTLNCAANDRKIFPIGKGPIPPLLFNCRSLRIPNVNPDFVIADLEGIRPSVGASGAKLESGRTTFNSFMKRQPKEFQNEYFRQFKNGAEKAKLFRNGGLHIDKYTNNRSIEYSLSQLISMNPAAATRANL